MLQFIHNRLVERREIDRIAPISIDRDCFGKVFNLMIPVGRDEDCFSLGLIYDLDCGVGLVEVRVFFSFLC